MKFTSGSIVINPSIYMEERSLASLAILVRRREISTGRLRNMIVLALTSIPCKKA